ncbi:hypothetical protein SHIRM173S_09155 [Streptomyces hirsutus]
MTSSSAIWAPYPAELWVNLSCTSAWRPVTGMVTVLPPEAGLNV